MAKQLPVTEFDILTLPDYLQLFKALIPFMEYGFLDPKFTDYREHILNSIKELGYKTHIKLLQLSL